MVVRPSRHVTALAIILLIHHHHHHHHHHHPQIRNPTAFAGVAVHPLEGVIQLALPANLIQWVLPVNFWLQSALMMIILLGGGGCLLV